ncbi:UDP-GlcNAc:undecaprenyl-phosphate GlcNAc-1-phosphate transferase [Sediminihabitans luteus]|uniref:UDP-GlcNAc:undecaprenyl-phosphate GlcNAc-1-phosphate transferase n=1 Tax=Sediminihabitans luteus TaxID=1138585 RepID=A0A2M9CDQ3_9CELL|nr:MraY family glycosyltransferase [Sediminihabitans luteus]PJJ70061.1 UDP-GlcNAc:undecaprenyl-phosphate GlcNAc-1-phosphate transferase [Sediminihabitans luteus]GIJ00155.1 undecaprenyl-phosphate alpha-N-acetylglucosaminyl 1-phosphate transferase [Sediminihabitans luteus]
MRVYVLIMVIAATVTFLLTPFARWVAIRTNAISAVRARDVHTVPTPRLGGIAITLGFAVAVAFGSRMPFLEGVFARDDQAWAVVGAAALVCLLGWADDVWDLDWMTKLAGQCLAAGFLAFAGVQLITLPIFGRTITSGPTSLFLTVFVVVLAMNAVNFVDGLDGLAAGVIAIGGSAFFLYTYLLTRFTSAADFSSLATLLMAALVGVCLGFLPHNFNPARIFMGDSGSMVLGLVIAAAGIIVTGRIDPDTINRTQSVPAFVPILLPLAVLMLPLLDFGLAVVRRLSQGKSPFHPDRMHLHHRMLQLGHSKRRAVVILYVWTAVFAYSTLALFFWPWRQVLAGTVIAAAVAILVTLGPLRTRGRFLDDEPATAAPALHDERP